MDLRMTLRMTLRLLPSPRRGTCRGAGCRDLNLGCTGEANGWIEGIHKLAKAAMSPNPSARREPGEPVPRRERDLAAPVRWAVVWGSRCARAAGNSLHPLENGATPDACPTRTRMYGAHEMSPTSDVRVDNSMHSSNIHLLVNCVPQHTLWSQHSDVSLSLR